MSLIHYYVERKTAQLETITNRSTIGRRPKGPYLYDVRGGWGKWSLKAADELPNADKGKEVQKYKTFADVI